MYNKSTKVMALLVVSHAKRIRSNRLILEEHDLNVIDPILYAATSRSEFVYLNS